MPSIDNGMPVAASSRGTAIRRRASRSLLRCRRLVAVVAALGIAFTALPASAVIIIGSSAGNTSAPADAGLATRWGQVGNFSSFMGTPIASQYFVTAKHLGNLTGQSITFPDSSSYTATALFTDPNSDLAIYQISGSFPSDKIVPMYAGGFTANQSMTIFGRGLPRTNTEVIGDRFGAGTEAKGWLWGSGTGTRSWGTNTLDGLLDQGAPGIQLVYGFDSAAGNNEGTLSTGDSGGPVFMQESGEWRLAGINYAVEAAFNTTGTGTGFNAAIYDKGGLYAGASISGPWQYVTPSTQDQPAYSLSSSIPANSAWISSVITVPEPGAWGLLVSAGAVGVVFRWRRRALRRSKHGEMVGVY